MQHVNLKLSIASFNTLMAGLQEMPFRLANPVVQEIMPQVEEQKKAAKDATKSSTKSDGTVAE